MKTKTLEEYIEGLVAALMSVRGTMQLSNYAHELKADCGIDLVKTIEDALSEKKVKHHGLN